MGGGGKGGGPTGPTAEQEANQAGKYWQSYSGWMQDAKSSFERDVSNIRARSGAAGSASGELLQQQIAERERMYAEEVRGIEQGEHGRWLKDYKARMERNPMVVFAQRNAPPRQPLSVEEYYTQRFGAARFSKPPSDEQARAMGVFNAARRRAPAVGAAGGPIEGSGLIRDQERLRTGWW